MKKIVNTFFVVLLPAVCIMPGCASHGKGKKQAASFFPVNEYIRQQIKLVDSGAAAIYKITVENGKKDSTILNKQQFKQVAKTFLKYDINAKDLHGSYIENIFVDGTTRSLTFSYTTEDKTLPLQSEDVLVDTASQQVKWVFLNMVESSGAATVTQKAGWQNNRSFFINRSSTNGDSTAVQQNIIVWKNAP